MAKLRENVALVTGGSSGIGRTTALLFAKEGAKVAIASSRQKEGQSVADEIRSAGGNPIFIKTDVSKANDCANAVSQTVATFGKLDVAFNHAGIEAFGKPVAGTDESTWDSVLAIVASAFGGCSCHASKAGIIGLTKAAALEYAKQNIRVNSICPAFVATAMVQKFPEETGMTDQIEAFHPVGRLGTEGEIAEAVVFLASHASSFMTGTALSVDGGMAAN